MLVNLGSLHDSLQRVRGILAPKLTVFLKKLGTFEQRTTVAVGHDATLANHVPEKAFR